MKYLVVGLGNIGAEYDGTRHNIGFRVADYLASKADAIFADRRYGFVSKVRVKNAELLLLKPSTYMNLSGNAVRYWLREENIPVERMLVIVDDISLPLGTIRIKPSGSAAGHNGLKHIATILGTEQYARLRFGIGGDFPRGAQIDYVLGHFTAEEEATLALRVPTAAEAVKAYALSGLSFAMNHYNGTSNR